MKPGDKPKSTRAGDITRYLVKRRKELLAKIFILQDLNANYRFQIPRHPRLERELNEIHFDMPLLEMLAELRLIDGKTHRGV